MESGPTYEVVGFTVLGTCPLTGRSHVAPIRWAGGPGVVLAGGSLPPDLPTRECGCEPGRVVRDDLLAERAAVATAPVSEDASRPEDYQS